MNLRTKVLIGFSLPLAGALMASVVGYRALTQSVSAARGLSETYRSVASANALAKEVDNAAIAHWRYLATGTPALLEAVQAASDRVAGIGLELRTLVRDNPPQAARAARLEEIFSRWRSDVAGPERHGVGRLDQPGDPSAVGRILAGTGGDVLDEFHGVAEEFIQAERRLLQHRAVENERTERWSTWVTPVVPSVMFLLWLAMAFLLALHVVGSLRSLAAATDALAAGNLSHRVAVRGRDETGSLARSFNAMAEQIESRERETLLLQQMGDLLQACLSLKEAIAVITSLAVRILPARTGRLFLMKTSRDHLDLAAAWGEGDPTQSTSFRPEECWALRRGRIHGMNEGNPGVPCQHLPACCRGPFVCIPLLAHGETVGVMHLEWHPPGEGHDERTAQRQDRLARALAEHIALALGNLRLRDMLRDQSIRDQLTGLFNRRYLEETLGREIRRADRMGQPVGVIMFDLNHFKQLNDRLGHDAGNAVLKELGPLVSAALRRSDMACRYGGEEFVLILPEASLDATQKRAEYIWAAIRRTQLVHRGHIIGPVTASIGVAVFPDHGTTEEALLRAADDALYAAKNRGKDQIVTAMASPGGRNGFRERPAPAVHSPTGRMEQPESPSPDGPPMRYPLPLTS